MSSLWRIKYLQFREHAQANGVVDAMVRSVYRYEEAVPVELDLAALKPLQQPPQDGLRVLDLGQEEHARLGLAYDVPSREVRAQRYFGRFGYRTIVMVRDGKVVGDLWYARRTCARTPVVHPHVEWFGIELGDDDVYMFDMHVSPEARGGGFATHFMNSALHHLRRCGARRAYGYFAAGNTPALWTHRLLGFRERPRVVIRKFLAYETVSPSRGPEEARSRA